MPDPIFYDITRPTTFDGTRRLAERTKAKADENDPSPDLTIEVAACLAKNEHSRKQWGDYSITEQERYIWDARLIIVNIRRFDYANRQLTQTPITNPD
jgi:hypothetical protein